MIFFSSLFTILVAADLAFASPVASSGVVACFYGSWARYRTGHGQIGAEDLDPSSCTHLIYTFAGLDDKTNEIKSLDPWNDLPTGGGYGSYSKATAFKNDYPNLKVTLCIGGSTESPQKFSNMAHDADARQTFIESVVAFLNKYNFDGLDLDWLTPTTYDQDAYVLLVSELKEALSKEKLILTVTIPVDESSLKNGYDLNKISQNVDLIHIMTYNYHSIYDGVVGANAPIKNILSSIDSVVKLGGSVEKLVPILPLYGTANILVNEDDADYGSRISGGFHGPWLQQDGILGYNEICNLLNDGGWKHGTEGDTTTAYEQKGDEMIVYDDAETIAKKAEEAVKKGVSGVALWAVEMDDAFNDCGDGSWRLIRAAEEGVNGGS